MQLNSARARRPQDPLQRDALRLHEALSELVRVYQFRDRTSTCCYGISVTQCYALEALVKDGAMTLGQLAALLWLDKSTASRVVDSLEEAGHVRRAPHPTDGRALQLRATASGRALHDRIVRGLVEDEKALLAEFEPAVREAAPRLLAGLARAAAARSRRPVAARAERSCS